MPRKIHQRNNFGEHISRIEFSLNLEQLNQFVRHGLSDQMMSGIYVLHPSMRHLVYRNV